MGEVLKQYGKSQAYEQDADVYYYMGNAAEQYYKDKSKAIKYYQQYLDTNPENATWVKNAKDRIKVLKELRFMRGKKQIRKSGISFLKSKSLQQIFITFDIDYLDHKK